MCTWLKFLNPALDRIFRLYFLRVSKVIPSHPCFTAPCLTHSCLRTSLHRFLHLRMVRPRLLRCYILRCVHPLPPCKEGYALADWLNNPLSQVTSPSPSSKSAANTFRLMYFRERAVSKRTLTIRDHCDASEVYDTADVGRLTSPLFCLGREASAIANSVSCSQTHSSVEKSMRDVESRIGESATFSNGKGNNSVRTKRCSRLL